MEKKQKDYTPVLPFDPSPADFLQSYDNVTYYCDRDLCYPSIRINTGHIVKYNRYRLNEEKVIIS